MGQDLGYQIRLARSLRMWVCRIRDNLLRSRTNTAGRVASAQSRYVPHELLDGSILEIKRIIRCPVVRVSPLGRATAYIRHGTMADRRKRSRTWIAVQAANRLKYCIRQLDPRLSKQPGSGR